MFPFGFGLSYTQFAYDNLRLSADAIASGDGLTVNVDVSNTGARMGQEIVQLYVRDAAAKVARPPKELKAFAKVELAPGEKKTVTLDLKRDALTYWDDAKHAWVAEAGDFEALVGSSSQDIRARTAFRLTDTVVFGGPAKIRRDLSVNDSVRELLEDDAARAVLVRHLPEFAAEAEKGMASGLALVQMAGLNPEQFPEEKMRAIGDDLAALYSGAGNS